MGTRSAAAALFAALAMSCGSPAAPEAAQQATQAVVPSVAPVATPDLSADYLEKVTLDWQAIRSAWTAKVDLSNGILTPENQAVVDGQKASYAVASRLQLVLRSLEPAPEGVRLLHEGLLELVASVLAYEEASEHTADAATAAFDPFGSASDYSAAKERTRGAMEGTSDARQRINQLIPLIDEQFAAASSAP